MSGHILLIGGGEISKGETKVIDDKLKSLISAGSKLLFFPTAAEDSEGYIQIVQQVFGDIFEVVSVTETQGRENAVKQLQTAQAVYLGGGRTELLLDLFEEWDLIGDLKGILDRGGVVAGISAGAQALSTAYTDFDADVSMETKTGWNISKIYCLVHAKEEQIARVFDVYQKSGRQVDIPFIGIGERAAWHVHDGGAEKIGEGPAWFASEGVIDKGTKAL
jgi:peptidase E